MENKTLNEILKKLCNNYLSAEIIYEEINKLYNSPFNLVLMEIDKLTLNKLFNIQANINHLYSINNKKDKLYWYFISTAITLTLSFFTGLISGAIVSNINNIHEKGRTMYVIFFIIFIFIFFTTFYPWCLNMLYKRHAYDFKLAKLLFYIDFAIENKKEELKNERNEDSNENTVEVKSKVNKNKKKQKRKNNN